MKVHIVGALPGPLGGTTILLKQLVDDIKDNSDVSLIISDTSKVPNLKFSQKLKFLYSTLKKTLASDVTSVHVSSNGSVTIAPIILILCLTFNKKFNFRMFGGVYDKFFINSNFIIKKIVSFVINKSDLVYFETRQLVNYFSKHFPNSNIKHYTNSRPSTLLRSDVVSDNKFIYLGAIKYSKGINVILEATKDNPLIDVDFYGPIVDVELESAINNNKNCRYKGVCQPEQILEVIKNYKCLLLPTEHFGEGYPGVIIEAYSLGVPVITTSWQCIPEIVVSGQTGFLIEPSNPQALAFMLQKVINMEDEKFIQLKNNCLSYFTKNFDSKLLSRVFVSDLKSVRGEG